MNAAALKYAVTSVKAIEGQRIERLKASLTTPAKNLTNAEQIGLIENGEVLPVLDAQGNFIDTNWMSRAFDFSAHITKETVDPGFASRAQAIRDQAKAITDELYLGDEAQALALIRAFQVSGV